MQITRNYKYLFLVLIAMLISFSATPQVTADFTTINSTSGCGSLVVEFKDLSLGNPTAWLWDFGNGNTSTLQNPIVIYNTPGFYDVELLVNDGFSVHTRVVNSYIIVHEIPISALQLSSSSNGCMPFNSFFEDLSISNASIVSWQWDFGDGGASYLQNPSHTYLNEGQYSISLSVIDVNGCQDLATEIDLLEINEMPIADFTNDISFSCDTSKLVSFNNSTISASSFLWDFGDGETSTIISPSHEFSTGIFSVTLYANQGGCVDTLVMTDLIEIMGSFSPEFTADTNSGCEGLSVNFFDLTDGNSNTFLWDFGDGVISILQNPTHIFDTAGIYDVTLTTSISGQCSTSVIFPSEIEVFSKPIIIFMADTTFGCSIPFDVMFLDSTIDATHWSWDFGDGSFSNIQNPINTYSSAGVFDVSLLVKNNNGCLASIYSPNHIMIDDFPIADLSAIPLLSCAGENISFTNLSSASSTEWHWYFGDDSNSNSQHPIHQYSLPGLYDVTLISSANSCNDTLVISDYIEIIEPAAIFDEIYNCYEPLRVEFKNLSIGADNVFWDFGDGTTSTLLNPIHDFLNLGVHTISLSVVNYITGCSNVFTKNIKLTNPIANFNYLLNTHNSYEDSTGCVPKRVYLDQQSQDCSYYKVLWSDGYVGHGRIDHLFTDVGIFDVSMIITDIHGCKDTSTIENMYHTYDVDVDFGISNLVGCDSISVEFEDLSSHPFASVKWDFGDGGNSILNNPQYIYYNEGVYDVTLYTKSIYGCRDTIKKLDYINFQHPSANFLTNIEDICVGDEVQFTNLSEGIGISSNWDFGDGMLSDLLHTNHVYTLNGSYDINLFIIDSFGCIDNLNLSDHIQVLTPTANFSSLDLHSNCPPLISNFTNLSSSDAIYFNWNFGDGYISNVEEPSHLFTNTGLFNVSLIVENTFGCSDTFFENDYINMLGVMPVGSFIVSDTVICKNDVVSFIPSVVNVSNFLWDFGNGVVSTDSFATALYSNEGVYTPTLVIENSSGCQITLNTDGAIMVNEVIVDAGLDMEICEGESVELISDGNGFVVNWTPANVLSSSNINNPHAHPITSGFFYVSHTQGQCVAVDSVFVTVHNDVPDATFTAVNFCDGNPTSFVANSGLTTTNNTYMWSFGQIGQVVNSALNIGSNNITLIIENLNNSCKDTFVQNITIFPNPVSDFLATNTCLGELLDLNNNSSINTMIWAYDFGDGIGVSADQNPSYIFTSPGVYNVTLSVTSDMGCKDSVTKDVMIHEIPVADFAIENHCEGYGNHFIDLSSVINSDIVLVEYNFNDGYISNDSILTHVFSGYGLFDVTLTATSAYGCSNSKVRTTQVYANPIVDFTASQFCKGEQTVFNNFSFVDNGYISSNIWKFGLEGSSGSENTTHTFSSDGEFNVDLSIISNRGCESILSKKIMIHKIPSVNFEIQTDICLGEELQISYLADANDANVLSWNYNLGDGSSSNEQNPTHFYNYVSSFDVCLDVVSLEGCKNDTIMPAIIETHKLPDASFQASKLFASELSPVISFYNLSEGATLFEWNFDNGEYSFEENPTISFNNPKIYNVVLTVTNDVGCSSEMIKNIQINPHYTFFVPDAFTPDGDGLNDVFTAKGGRVLSFEMQIFDRWGSVIFESLSIDLGWDGRISSGDELSNGIYLYHITIYDLNERLWVYNGELNLIR